MVVLHKFCLGALLNLRLDNGKKSAIDFDAEFKRLSGKRKAFHHQNSDESTDTQFSDSETELESGSESDDEVADLIDFIIGESKLGPIMAIRRDEQQTIQLKQDLKQLVKKKTLDREQLKSFIESLIEPVHLTQGPPGTGKSYLGVVIVQALIKIRNAWMAVCPSVGEPPILVLSYKNHAIDEFLVDLVKSEGNVSLVRIGGSCNDPNLKPYLETNQIAYKYKTERSRTILRRLHDQRTQHQEMKNKLSPLSGWEALRESVPVDKESADAMKQESQQAIVYFCGILDRIRKIENFLARTETDSGSNISDSQDESEEFSDVWESLFSEDDRDIVHNIEETCIEALWTDAKHYGIKVPEMLLRWLNGFKPLPNCAYSQCSQIVNVQGYKYCNRHLCYHTLDNQRCPNPLFNRLLCDEHACQVEKCEAVKLPLPQVYCEDHACFICVKEECIAKLGTDEPPRNTCSDHKLCTALITGESCINLAVKDTPFCGEHTKATCSYKFPNGQQCLEYAASLGISYCNDHKPKAKNVIEFKQFTSKKCKAQNKKKKPCKGNAMEGFQYCKDHAVKFREISIESETEKEKTWDTGLVESSLSEAMKPETYFSKLNIQISMEEAKEENKLNETGTELGSEEKCKTSNTGEENLDDFELSEYEEPLPDEVDIRPDDEEEYYCEEDDQLQHCRDVHVIEDREVEVKSDEEDNSVGGDLMSESDVHNDTEVPVSQWTWEMSLKERWTQAKLQEQKYKLLLTKLQDKRNVEIEIAREEYHNAKVRAKSEVYEKKAVIGGTIVGCIGRLESIRKTKPFAILVEEASEVLEPLLFACLGDETKKFEMIGDHLQLKPSIMSKMIFERLNR